MCGLVIGKGEKETTSLEVRSPRPRVRVNQHKDYTIDGFGPGDLYYGQGNLAVGMLDLNDPNDVFRNKRWWFWRLGSDQGNER
jgi:hypothetical protein